MREYVATGFTQDRAGPASFPQGARERMQPGKRAGKVALAQPGAFGVIAGATFCLVPFPFQPVEARDQFERTRVALGFSAWASTNLRRTCAQHPTHATWGLARAYAA